MDNELKIDSIIEELNQKVKIADKPKEAELILSDEQLALKDFLDDRRIRYLIHFTDAKNIPSIILQLSYLPLQMFKYEIFKNNFNSLLRLNQH